MSFGSFVTGSVLGGALVYGSLCWHVLRTDDGYEFVRKTSGDFAETYVDVRDFSMSDWSTHKTLSADIVASKKERLFQAAAVQPVTQMISQPVSQMSNEVQNMASFGSWAPTQTR